MKAAEFAPMYLRLSQAERERMEKENITTRAEKPLCYNVAIMWKGGNCFAKEDLPV